MDKMFGLNGIAGLLIAVVLLLSIVGFLGTQAVFAQQSTADKPYSIDTSKLKMFSTENGQYKTIKE